LKTRKRRRMRGILKMREEEALATRKMEMSSKSKLLRN
jgi:hypothetical protein